MVIASFLIDNKDGESRFYEKTFLLTYIIIDITFGILFFILSNVQIDFYNRELRWRLYISVETLQTTQRVELSRKKEFVATAHNLDNKAFKVYVAPIVSYDLASSDLASLNSIQHPSCQAQITS